MSREMERRMDRIEAALAPTNESLHAWLVFGGEPPRVSAALLKWLESLDDGADAPRAAA